LPPPRFSGGYCRSGNRVERSDAAAITEIYNEGIADRIGTFETEPRSTAQIGAWFDEALAIVAVADRGVSKLIVSTRSSVSTRE
jgi:L-amino acid N-acyltransferase YncA